MARRPRSDAAVQLRGQQAERERGDNDAGAEDRRDHGQAERRRAGQQAAPQPGTHDHEREHVDAVERDEKRRETAHSTSARRMPRAGERPPGERDAADAAPLRAAGSRPLRTS
jgi:hypothetical protein